MCVSEQTKVFDHASRLQAGTHTLPLLQGEVNPVGNNIFKWCSKSQGISVDSMNLAGSDKTLEIMFPSGIPVVFPEELRSTKNTDAQPEPNMPEQQQLKILLETGYFFKMLV